MRKTATNNGQGIPPRVRRRFLQLAAIAFALGAESALADPSAIDSLDEAGRAAATLYEASEASAGDASSRLPYQHVLLLGSPTPLPNLPARAQLQVIDELGDTVLKLPVHGASMVGPLAAGAYTVLVKTDGPSQVQRLRIGAGAASWLHLSEPA